MADNPLCQGCHRCQGISYCYYLQYYTEYLPKTTVRKTLTPLTPLTRGVRQQLIINDKNMQDTVNQLQHAIFRTKREKGSKQGGR